MLISWEIHFRKESFAISEQADAFDHVKTDFRNVLRAQPFQNGAPLKRNG